MHVLHTISGLERELGGIPVSVIRICEELGSRGVTVELLSQVESRENGDCFPIDPLKVNSQRVTPLPVVGKRLGYSRQFKKAIRSLCHEKGVQIVHSNGLWLLCNHDTVKTARKQGLPIIIQPHGMLEAWALEFRSKRKSLAWELYQRKDLSSATIFFATSMKEAASIRKAGFSQPIAIIPFGVDLPLLPSHTIPREGIRTALFMSRIHPIKGIMDLVKAWAIVRPAGWRLIIAGPDEQGHREDVESEIKKARLSAVISLVGAVADQKKSDLLQNANLFILPSLSESFGIVVADALSYGIPVITTIGTPWKSLADNNCGWWVPLGLEPLVGAIDTATTISDDERQAMGGRGRTLVEKEFTWKAAADKTLITYEWILGLANRPDFIIADNE